VRSRKKGKLDVFPFLFDVFSGLSEEEFLKTVMGKRIFLLL